MKTLKNKYVIVILLFHLNTYAQTWSFYKEYPVNVNPWMADSDNSGNLYMLTSSREIWKKDNSGLWNKFPDFPVSNFYDLKVNQNTGAVYLADEFQGLVFTANNGVSWQQAFFETSPLTGFHEAIMTLSNVNSSNVFFGGGYSTNFPFAPAIFKYTINGNEISDIQKIEFDTVVNYDNIPNAVFQTNDGSTILIGTVANGIWISTDEGEDFQNVLPGNQVYKIVQGPNDSFYALVRNSNTGQNQMIKSIDGVAWEPVYTNPDPNDSLTTLYFDEDSINLWLGTEKIVYRISNLDGTALDFESQNLNNAEQRVVAIVKSDGIIHQFSSEFILQKKVDDSWNQEINGLTGSSAQVLFGTNDTLYSLDYTSSVISKANDQQTDWVNTYIPGNIQAGLQNLSKDNNGNVFFTKLNKLFRMDASDELQEINVPNPNSNFISKLFVTPTGNIYLTHNNENNKLYRSTNGGETWDMFFESINTFDSFSSVCENNDGLIFFTLDLNEAQLHYSLNDGQNWNVFNYDVNSELECGSATESSIYHSGDYLFFTICLKTFLLQVNNNTLELTEVNFPNDSYPGHILSNANGFYTVSEEGIIYKSEDSGQTWFNMGNPAGLSPFANSVYPLLVTNSDNEVFVKTNPFAFGLPENLRGLYKLTETLDLPARNYFEVAIYPNPATDIINLRSVEVIAEYQFYDSLGKVISFEQLDDKRIDISKLSAGIYFLKLKTIEGRQQVVKIVKN